MTDDRHEQDNAGHEAADAGDLHSDPVRKWALPRRFGLPVVPAVLGALGLVALVMWLLAASVTQRYDGTRSVVIPRGASFGTVVDSLQAAGILRAEQRFRFLAIATGWHRQIKSGHYSVEEGVSNYRLLQTLRRGLQTPLWVTVPPGSRPGVVAAVLRRDLGIDSAAFVQALTDSALLADLETSPVHAFGQLLPDTYQFYWGTSPEQVISRLTAASDAYFDAERRRRAEALKLTEDEVLTLASIVEWEARLHEERPNIAGVYLNRLRIGMPLQADPTVQFALMDLEGGRMRRLLFEDYKVDHAYNTYLYYGLPPGPITNPSPSSIDAVLFAPRHEYLYFVADGSGGHNFSRSLREHNRAAAEYRKLMRARRRAQTNAGE